MDSVYRMTRATNGAIKVALSISDDALGSEDNGVGVQVDGEIEFDVGTEDDVVEFEDDGVDDNGRRRRRLAKKRTGGRRSVKCKGGYTNPCGKSKLKKRRRLSEDWTGVDGAANALEHFQHIALELDEEWGVKSQMALPPGAGELDLEADVYQVGNDTLVDWTEEKCEVACSTDGRGNFVPTKTPCAYSFAVPGVSKTYEGECISIGTYKPFQWNAKHVQSSKTMWCPTVGSYNVNWKSVRKHWGWCDLNKYGNCPEVCQNVAVRRQLGSKKNKKKKAKLKVKGGMAASNAKTGSKKPAKRPMRSTSLCGGGGGGRRLEEEEDDGEDGDGVVAAGFDVNNRMDVSMAPSRADLKTADASGTGAAYARAVIKVSSTEVSVLFKRGSPKTALSYEKQTNQNFLFLSAQKQWD